MMQRLISALLLAVPLLLSGCDAKASAKASHILVKDKKKAVRANRSGPGTAEVTERIKSHINIETQANQPTTPAKHKKKHQHSNNQPK